MFIAIAPSILASTRIAIMLWTLASGGQQTFIEVPTCAPHEAKNELCISVFETKTLPQPYAGKTWKYGNQYITLVIDSNPTVIAHELGHAIIGMRYHSTINTSIMSPYIGKKCLTQEDSNAYMARWGKALALWCLP